MRDILEILAPGAYVSGEKISEELGISRAAVWKRIEALRAQGYQIESAGKRGYRLLAGDGLEPVLWLDQLTTQALGRGEVRYEHELTSTNNVLKEMAALGAPHGSLCLCDAQTAGKGRLGRQWISPAGEGLWCSVLLRPRMKPEQAPFITLCTAMALAQAIDELCGVTVRIKWPNDLVLNGKKCVGILTELAADPDRVEYVVIGTGDQPAPARLRAGAEGEVRSRWRRSPGKRPCGGNCWCIIWRRWSRCWTCWKKRASGLWLTPMRREAAHWAAACR